MEYTTQQMNQLSDSEIIRLIRSDDRQQRNTAFHHLYKRYYGMAESIVVKNSGVKDDTKDVFQESVIAFYKAIKTGRFRADSTIKTYFFRICQNQWFGELRKRNREKPLEDKHEAIEIEEDHSKFIEQQEINHLIHQLLQELGKDCQKLLVSFYYYGMKMDKIRTQFNLASAQVAKNKKSNCMKTLRSKAKGNPRYRDLRNRNE